MKTDYRSCNKTGIARAERAFVGIIVAMVVGAAVAASIVWWMYSRRPTTIPQPPPTVLLPEEAPPPESGSGLSTATLSVLRALAVPVEIRFYSVWANNQSDEGNRLFAQKVSRLLALYEAEGAGKVAVKRFDSRLASGVPEAALSDGLDPLRRDRGESSFLGVAVVSEGRRAVLSRLSREWTDALEYDLSRAIAQVSRGSGSAAVASFQPVADPSPENAAAAEELLREMPELATLSKEEAERRVREGALEEFRQAVAGMQGELVAAQQRVASARAISPEAEQSAEGDLRALQAAQNKKLEELSRRLQARLAALGRLKGGEPAVPNTN